MHRLLHGLIRQSLGLPGWSFLLVRPQKVSYTAAVNVEGT